MLNRLSHPYAPLPLFSVDTSKAHSTTEALGSFVTNCHVLGSTRKKNNAIPLFLMHTHTQSIVVGFNKTNGRLCFPQNLDGIRKSKLALKNVNAIFHTCPIL